MLKLKHTRNDMEMAVLSKVFTDAMAVQKLYGKTPQQLGEFVEAFALFTDELPFEPLCMAIVKHIKEKNELPTPADVHQAINPPKPEITLGEYLRVS